MSIDQRAIKEIELLKAKLAVKEGVNTSLQKKLVEREATIRVLKGQLARLHVDRLYEF